MTEQMPTNSDQIIRQFIQKQLHFNRRKNVFYSGEKNKLSFLNETCDFIKILQTISSQKQEDIIDFTVEQALTEFYKINQYYNFNKEDQKKLKSIYQKLLNEIIHSDNNTDINAIADKHYSRIQNWLQASNPFAVKLYPENLSIIEEVVCAEYPAEMQIEILGIDTLNMLNPVLDIGCGANSYLVNFLKKSGFDAYGIDRNVDTRVNLIKADWLDYQFMPDSWGTVISNLGFSNHFRHHHLRNDGNYLAYARKYMEILQSLKQGGTFYYAPDLPFIETYLDAGKYEIHKKEIPLTEYYSVKIKRKIN